jgi:adenosylhomocysteinase
LDYDVLDLSLAELGAQRIAWAAVNMPVLESINERFKKEQPLKGIKIAACLHITTETANLLTALKSGGAEVFACASNPLSTQDDVAACLVKNCDIPTFAIRGEDSDTYYSHIDALLDKVPDITMDDGCDLVSRLHKNRPDQVSKVIGGTEETTTGVIRLRAMENDGALCYPIVAVNDADTKHMFDNRYGTGQSTLDGIIRATNILFAGKTVVVAGYGYCGKGVSQRAKGLGAKVIVTEVDPLRALEAVMDGFEVLPMIEACKKADVLITVTGNRDVVTEEHFLSLPDKAIVANSGHFDVELDLQILAKLAQGRIRTVRPNVEEYLITSESRDKRIYVIAQGRLVNLGAAEGHPAQVMDMSFANQALCVEWLVNNRGRLENKVLNVPKDIDLRVAELKLNTLGVKIDELTNTQRDYLSSWQSGT